jgi:pimeloyl-ACP methyl ester carboxylesterase
MKPIILVPGFAGSLLVKRGQEKYRPSIFSKEILDNRWVNLKALTAPPTERWRKDMYYSIKKANGKVIGFDNIPPDLYPHDIGGTQGIKDLIPEFQYLSTKQKEKLNSAYYYRYFNDICIALEKEGYADHVSLYGLPYDFRLILDPIYRESMFDYFRKVIDHGVRLGGDKAVVISHSLGSLVFKWFISTHPQYQQLIDVWISINAPFAGSHHSLKVVLCGDHYNPLLKTTIREELARNSGLIACFPNDLGFDRDEILATIGDKNICISNYNTFADADNISFQIHRDLFLPYLDIIKQPIAVRTHAIISVDNVTDSIFRIHNIGEQPYEVLQDIGDKIVVEKSLRSYEKIITQKGMKDLILPNNNHTSPLMDKQVIKLIIDYCKNKT